MVTYFSHVTHPYCMNITSTKLCGPNSISKGNNAYNVSGRIYGQNEGQG